MSQATAVLQDLLGIVSGVHYVIQGGHALCRQSRQWNSDLRVMHRGHWLTPHGSGFDRPRRPGVIYNHASTVDALYCSSWRIYRSGAATPPAFSLMSSHAAFAGACSPSRHAPLGVCLSSSVFLSSSGQPPVENALGLRSR